MRKTDALHPLPVKGTKIKETVDRVWNNLSHALAF